MYSNHGGASLGVPTHVPVDGTCAGAGPCGPIGARLGAAGDRAVLALSRDATTASTGRRVAGLSWLGAGALDPIARKHGAIAGTTQTLAVQPAVVYSRMSALLDRGLCTVRASVLKAGLKKSSRLDCTQHGLSHEKTMST